MSVHDTPLVTCLLLSVFLSPLLTVRCCCCLAVRASSGTWATRTLTAVRSTAPSFTSLIRSRWQTWPTTSHHEGKRGDATARLLLQRLHERDQSDLSALLVRIRHRGTATQHSTVTQRSSACPPLLSSCVCWLPYCRLMLRGGATLCCCAVQGAILFIVAAPFMLCFPACRPLALLCEMCMLQPARYAKQVVYPEPSTMPRTLGEIHTGNTTQPTQQPCIHVLSTWRTGTGIPVH